MLIIADSCFIQMFGNTLCYVSSYIDNSKLYIVLGLFFLLLVAADCIYSKCYASYDSLKEATDNKPFNKLYTVTKGFAWCYGISSACTLIEVLFYQTILPEKYYAYSFISMLIIANRSIYLFYKANIIKQSINEVSLASETKPLDFIFAIDFFVQNTRSVRRRIFYRSFTTTNFTWMFLVFFFDCLPRVLELSSFFVTSPSLFESLSWSIAKPTFFFYYPFIFGALFWRYDERFGKQWQTLTDIFYRPNIDSELLTIDMVNLELWSNKSYKTAIEYWLAEASYDICDKHSPKALKTILKEYDKDTYLSMRSPWELAEKIKQELEYRKKNGTSSWSIILSDKEYIELIRLHIDLQHHNINHFRVAERALSRRA